MRRASNLHGNNTLNTSENFLESVDQQQSQNDPNFSKEVCIETIFCHKMAVKVNNNCEILADIGFWTPFWLWEWMFSVIQLVKQ